MTRRFHPCRKYRESLCAVMSGDISPEDHAALEDHLEVCAECRKYRNEIGGVTALLSAGGELFRDVDPSESTRSRWARDFQKAVEPANHSRRLWPRPKVLCRFLDWCRDMVWPSRRIWAGMAAIWLVILGLNLSQRTKEQAQGSNGPSPEMIRAFLALEGFLPGSTPSADAHEAEPARQRSPRPRSERHGGSNPA